LTFSIGDKTAIGEKNSAIAKISLLARQHYSDLRIWFSLGLFFPYVYGSVWDYSSPTSALANQHAHKECEKQPLNFNSARADFNLELHPDFILE